MYSFLASEVTINGNISSLLKYDNLTVSKSFIVCADEQLYYNFLNITGLKSINKCGISCTMDGLQYGAVSTFETSMGINGKSQWAKVCWRSHSGKIYHRHDEVDCSDIQFWLENVDVPLLYKQLYGPTTLPFKLPTTHYQLVIGSISIALDLALILKYGDEQAAIMMDNELNTFIGHFNSQSEKKNRKDGLVHNWKTSINGHVISVEMDLGSAGSTFLKKLLKWLNGFEQVAKVVVGNTSEL